MNTYHGEYCDPDGLRPALRGKTALVQEHATYDAAQFDDLSLPHRLTHGWTLFPPGSFKRVPDEVAS